MTKIILTISFLYLHLSVFANTVYSLPLTIGKPEIHRDSKGQYDACGIRLVGIYEAEKNDLVLDTTFWLTKSQDKTLAGLVEVRLAQKIKNNNQTRFYKLKKFNIFPENNNTNIELSGKTISTSDKNTLIAFISRDKAVDLISSLIASAPLHFELFAQSEIFPLTLRIKNQPLSEVDIEVIQNCTNNIN